MDGVGLPSERPVVKLEDISPGTKFNDPETSVALLVDIATCLVTITSSSTTIHVNYSEKD